MDSATADWTHHCLLDYAACVCEQHFVNDSTLSCCFYAFLWQLHAKMLVFADTLVAWAV
jgi:hypothetical protein